MSRGERRDGTGSGAGAGARAKVLHADFRAQSLIKILVIGLASLHTLPLLTLLFP